MNNGRLLRRRARQQAEHAMRQTPAHCPVYTVSVQVGQDRLPDRLGGWGFTPPWSPGEGFVEGIEQYSWLNPHTNVGVVYYGYRELVYVRVNRADFIDLTGKPHRWFVWEPRKIIARWVLPEGHPLVCAQAYWDAFRSCYGYELSRVLGYRWNGGTVHAPEGHWSLHGAVDDADVLWGEDRPVLRAILGYARQWNAKWRVIGAPDLPFPRNTQPWL